jgi:hypothetical protein
MAFHTPSIFGLVLLEGCVEEANLTSESSTLPFAVNAEETPPTHAVASVGGRGEKG